jgi:hypothetical protein
MRAKYRSEEAEIAAPHKAEASRALALAREERDAREKLERLLQNKMLPHILEKIGHKLGDGVHREIMNAVSSQKSFTGITKLELPTSMLVSADPGSVVGRIVDTWRTKTAPRMSIRAGVSPLDRSITVLDIRLPEMGYREQVLD